MWFAVTGWEITEWTIALAAFITAAGVIWTKVLHPVIRWGKRLDESTAWTHEQMKPNGGATLVDKVNKLVGDVSEMKRRIDRVGGQMNTSLRHDAERDIEGKRYQTNRGDGLADDVAEIKAQMDLSLRHDAERDTPGKRYDTEPTEGDTP